MRECAVPRYSAMPHLMPAMPTRTHILVVNGRKVRQPVFVIGAPHSGADVLTRAFKRTPGFHFTVGQPSVLSVVYAFARTPSIQEGRDEATATVLRDAFAQAWQVTAHACLTCRPECQGAMVRSAGGTCVDEREITRYGDASPALVYSADSLVDAFPDARIIQIVRDGRAVVAAMLSDPEELAWFRGGVANVDSEFPNPFFGIDTGADQTAWAALSATGKCAMRWRGAVHKMARLRNSLSAEQLTTIRYEQLVSEPDAAAAAIGEFVNAEVTPIVVPHAQGPAESWRRLLSPAQLAEIDRVAGQQLRRVGYGN
jgi:Sulfotransferase family